MSLTEAEILRFSRHIILREVGGRGQRKLKEASVLIAGLGAVGSAAALYLRAAGIGTLTLWDSGVLTPGDMAGAIGHEAERIGWPRARSAALTLRAINPDAELVVLDREVDLLSGLAAFDVILASTGPWEELAAGAREVGVPLILAAAHGGSGAVTLLAPEGPCFRCMPEAVRFAAGLYPEEGGGAIAPAAGVIGTVAATEVIKRLLGVGEGLVGRLLTWDGWDAVARETVWGENCVHLTKNP
jgi:molybdopterin/thiamine biosynthesis adenylyltransferase